jgi:hypothetical protein
MRVFENAVSRYESKGEDVTGGYKHNEELHRFCSSPNIIMAIKSRRASWEENVAHMGGDKESIRTFSQEI